MVDFMVNTLDYVREIQHSSEIRDDEYLVLFRASGNDFHFIRRMEDGSWAHKMGSSKITTLTRKDFCGLRHKRKDNYKQSAVLVKWQDYY